MALSMHTIAIIVLFHLIMYLAVVAAMRNVSDYESSESDACADLSGGPCNRPTGMYIKNGSGDDGLDLQSVDCDQLCGGVVVVESDEGFRAVLVTEDTFIDGERPSRTGVHCVRKGAHVTRCNTITSKLVRGANGSWSCQPRWPAIFGGADGGDILVCGGKLTDGTKRYEYRLPPSRHMRPIIDPYAEIDRFKCTPGEYVGGPRDYVNNEYLTLDSNRFYRIRNNCAKYVPNAIGMVGPVSGDSRLCNCLETHGPLRRRAVRVNSEVTSTQPAAWINPTSRRLKREELRDGVWDDRKPIVFQAPYACSPCVASGDLISTDGVFNFPVRCTKPNQRYFENIGFIDKQPCGGAETFSSATKPPCLNTWITIGNGGMSCALKKAISGL